jgi:hypothetical protein
MTHHPPTKGHFRYVPLTLVLLALLIPALGQARSAEEGHAHQDQPAKVYEQQGQASNHDHDHNHNHGKDGGELRPALPKSNPSPTQLAQLAKLRREALAQAEKTYRSMKLDPALASLGLGFDHDGRVFDMGMTLEQALIKVLAGGNRCRVKSTPDGKSGSSCRLNIITKDKRLMSLQMQPAGDKLMIQSMTLTKLDGDGGIQQTGAKAAFYLMTFMRSR